MPTFKACKSDKHGNFFLKFNRDKVVDFYGQKISEIKAFKCYGNFSHNNILNNKLIGVLGKNLLDLEKQQKERDNGHTRLTNAQKEDVNFYANMEREGNAFTINLLDTLSELEQDRFQSDNKLHIGKVSYKLKDRVKNLFEERIKRIKQERGKLSNPQPISPDTQIKINRLIKIAAQVASCQQNILNSLNDSDRLLNSLYRDVMYEFANEQRIISVYQHSSDRALDYANQSLTEAFQNGSYEIESHVYSGVKPKTGQLWNELDKQTEVDPTPASEYIVLDTRQFPEMKKEDAIASAALLTGDNVIEDTKNNVGQVKLASRKYKSATKELLTRSKEEQAEWKSTGKPEKSSRSLSDIFEEAKSKREAAGAQTRPIDQESDLEALRKEDAEFCGGSQALVNEGEVKLYHSTDLFAAVGMACSDFGKYFEKQMASKHPAMTGAAFVAASATFGTAGLAAAGSHSMAVAFHHISQILTANGHLGLSPTQFQTGVQAITNGFGHLTHVKGLFETLIIDGFGLPKMNYVVFDKIFNGFQHKDTIHQLAKQMSKQDLEHLTEAEQAKKIAANIVKISMMLTMAVVLGIGTYKLAHIVGHGFVSSAAHGTGAAAEHLIHVPPSVFSDLLNSHSIAQEMIAITSAILTIKTAGLFLGKAMLLLSHMREELGDKLSTEETEAYILMARLKDAFEQDPEEYKRLMDTIGNDINYYRYQIESLMAKTDKIETFFGAEFLVGIGAKKPYVNAVSNFFSTAANKTKTFIVDGLWDKFTKPILLMGLAIGSLGLVPLLSIKSRKPIANAFTSTYLGLTNAVVMFGAAVKTIAIASWGTLQRGIMAASDGIFSIVSMANYGYEKGSRLVSNPSGKIALGVMAGLASVVAGTFVKIGITATSLSVQILNFAGKFTKLISTAAMAVATGAPSFVGTALTFPFALAGAAILGVVSKVKGDSSFAKGFSNAMDNYGNATKTWWGEVVVDSIKVPGKIASAISDNITQPLMAKISSASIAIDRETKTVAGADVIYSKKDNSTTMIGEGFDAVKRVFGWIAYHTRNIFLRSAENAQQKLNTDPVSLSPDLEGVSEVHLSDRDTIIKLMTKEQITTAKILGLELDDATPEVAVHVEQDEDQPVQIQDTTTAELDEVVEDTAPGRSTPPRL